MSALEQRRGGHGTRTDAADKGSSQITCRPAFEERWQRRFESFARGADDDAGIAGWSAASLRARVRQFSRLWSAGSRRGRWVDAGCGAGTYARLLAQQGIRVTGLDYSVVTVLKARERSSPTITWGAADVKHLPVRPDACDGIMCFGVLQALQACEPAIAELTGAVRPGGEVWVDALNGFAVPNLLRTVRDRLQQRPPHLRYESAGRLTRVMRDSGLEDVRRYWLPILPKRWERWQPLVETRIVRGLLEYIPFAGTLFSHAFIVCGRRAASSPSYRST